MTPRSVLGMLAAGAGLVALGITAVLAVFSCGASRGTNGDGMMRNVSTAEMNICMDMFNRNMGLKRTVELIRVACVPPPSPIRRTLLPNYRRTSRTPKRQATYPGHAGNHRGNLHEKLRSRPQSVWIEALRGQNVMGAPCSRPMTW